MLHISQVSKLDGIRSWSLMAGVHCPASVGAQVCVGCYAKFGNYRFPNVIEPRMANADDWKRDDWVDRMVSALDSDRYFRWFDSGDMYSISLARKILLVMIRTPWCKHWLATRMGKFPKFVGVLAEMMKLPNVMVRYSADDVDVYKPEHTAMVWHKSVPEGVTACSSYVKEDDKVAKCHGCRACWDKSVPVIGYKAHGVKMIKILEV